MVTIMLAMLNFIDETEIIDLNMWRIQNKIEKYLQVPNKIMFMH